MKKRWEDEVMWRQKDETEEVTKEERGWEKNGTRWEKIETRENTRDVKNEKKKSFIQKTPEMNRYKEINIET